MPELKTILIVEDEKFILDLLSTRLAEANYSVKKAKNGKEALEIIKDSQIDLILLDLLMAEIDGFVFLKKLRKSYEYKDVPVIVLTNLDKAKAKQKTANYGIEDYLIKSDKSLQDVTERVDAILKS